MTKILVFDNDYYNGEYVVIEHEAINPVKADGFLMVDGSTIGDGNWLEHELTVIEHAEREGVPIVEQGLLFDPEVYGPNDPTPGTVEVLRMALHSGILFQYACDVNLVLKKPQ